MMLKYKIYYISLCVFFLFSCNRNTLKDITTQDGIYIYKNNKRPVQGKINDYFENGKLSCQVNFENGIPIGEYTSYGYQGEVIATSKNATVIKENTEIWQKNNIVRLTVCNSIEGSNDVKSEFTNLFVVFRQKNSLNYDLLTTQLLDLIKSNNFDSSKIDTVYFCLGELERPFYEIKTKNIKK